MLKLSSQKNKYEKNLYNSILFLSRNRIFYTNFNLTDTFENRINLIFLHISFLFIKNKDNNMNETLKTFQQKLFDLTFYNIEINMRESGYSDTSINRNMKSLIRDFYNILFSCENYKKKTVSQKKNFLNNYLDLNHADKANKNIDLIEYFDKYQSFCLDLSLDNVLKGDFNFTNEYI